MNWKEISSNPVDSRVHDYILEELRSRKIEPVPDLMTFIKSFVSGFDVLDIGVVEHDISHMESKHWKHKCICEWADSVLGIDILKDEIDFLKDKGFQVQCVDATSDVFLGKRFDRVVIGDVIEHVNNPVKLLEFSRRHIVDGGKIMVSTPNPFFYKFILKMVREGTFIANAEHISWISPCMALELGRRADLTLSGYCLLHGRPKAMWKRLFKRAAEIVVGVDSELFSNSIVYIFEKS